MPSSLADFAVAQKPRRDCATCDLPEEVVAEIREFRRTYKGRDGFGRTVAAWLAAEGHQEASDQVEAHFRGRHWSR